MQGETRKRLPRQPSTPSSDPDVRLILDNLFYHGYVPEELPQLPVPPRVGEVWLVDAGVDGGQLRIQLPSGPADLLVALGASLPLGAIADADGSLADLTTKFNALLAALRSSGLMDA